MGNHDVAIIGRMSLDTFNGDAKRSLLYHEKVLSASNMEFIKSLPTKIKVRGEATMAHGSPRDPLWEYILNSMTASLNFDHFDTPWCFVGHTHIQSSFTQNDETGRVLVEQNKPDIVLNLHPKQILNPGSVGEPRDRDPRAAYAIYDTGNPYLDPQTSDV